MICWLIAYRGKNMDRVPLYLRFVAGGHEATSASFATRFCRHEDAKRAARSLWTPQECEEMGIKIEDHQFGHNDQE